MLKNENQAIRIRLSESIDTVPIRVLGRSHLACVRCRTQKTKCDGSKPSCNTCLLSNKECEYEFKDRKIILLESQINKLHDRIRYLENNLKELTVSSNIKIIDSSDEKHNYHNRATKTKSEEDSEIDINQYESVKSDIEDDYDDYDDDELELTRNEHKNYNDDNDDGDDNDDDNDDNTTKNKNNKHNNNDVDASGAILKKENDNPHNRHDSFLSSSFVNQKYPSFMNPLFGNPENFNKMYYTPHIKLKEDVDKILINRGDNKLDLSLRKLLEFDYHLQSCFGDFSCFDTLNSNPTTSHPHSKHYLSDHYFDFPSSGYVTLPDKEYCLDLFEIVYKRYCNTFYLFDKQQFIEEIDKVYESLNAQRSTFLCKLLITLAIGEQMVFSKLSFDPTFNAKYGDRLNSGIPGLKFFTLAIQLFRYNHENFSLANIQTCLLIAFYEQSLSRTTSLYSYNGLTLKLLILDGMHRQLPESKDPVTREKVKRLWWSLFSIYSLCCARLHLPPVISYQNTEVDLPKENYIDLNDGFKIDHLQAHVMIARYSKDIILSLYSSNSRTYDRSFVPESENWIWEKTQKTLFFVEEFEKVKADIAPIFQRHEQLLANGKSFEDDDRDDQNVILHYYSILIFAVRPVVLSLFRGLVMDSPEMSKLAQVAITSSCEIVRALKFLKDNFLLHTFDYYDHQFCFTALIIFTVAGLSGIRSPFCDVGIEIMVFMANNGNHTARSYFAKLVTLENCLLSSGAPSVFEKRLSSLITYKLPEKNEEIDPEHLNTNKVDIKAAPKTTKPKQTHKASSTSSIPQMQIKSLQQLLQQQLQNQQLQKKQLKQPLQLSTASKKRHSTSKIPSKRTNQHPKDDLYIATSTSGESQRLILSTQPSVKTEGCISTTPGFTTDPEFFRDLVSNIQVWDESFQPDFSHFNDFQTMNESNVAMAPKSLSTANTSAASNIPPKNVNPLTGIPLNLPQQSQLPNLQPPLVNRVPILSSTGFATGLPPTHPHVSPPILEPTYMNPVPNSQQQLQLEQQEKQQEQLEVQGTQNAMKNIFMNQFDRFAR